MTRGRKAATIAAGVGALVAVGVAVSPDADALSAVKLARRALNADKVDGISASRIAKPNELLALNGKKVLPATARNALAVGGFSASAGAQANSLLVLDANAQFPPSVVAQGFVKGRTYTGTVGFTARADGAPDATDDALSSWMGADIAFPTKLELALDEGSMGILGGGIELPDCEGTFEAPTAPAGELCIYPGREVSDEDGVLPEDAEIINIAKNGEGSLEAYVRPIGDGSYGVRVEAKAAAAGTSRFYATWAYTAP